MLPYMPARKVKKTGQATHKEVLQNKNCSNVNIVNMKSQKPSLREEWFKKPATMYKYKYKKHQEEVICYDKQCQETKRSVCEGKKCPSTQCSDMKPVMKNKDVWSREPATEAKSSLYRDSYCQSTRCFKKATRCSYTKSPQKPICGDDKNCQSPQFVRPKKPNNAMQLKHPAVNKRKMQSDPEKRQHMKASQKEDSSFKEVQSHRRQMKPKRMQPVK